MLVLACSVSMVAQTGMSSDSSMKKSDSMGKPMTMTGGISEKDGEYTQWIRGWLETCATRS
jgi:hypothetical protein